MKKEVLWESKKKEELLAKGYQLINVEEFDVEIIFKDSNYEPLPSEEEEMAKLSVDGIDKQVLINIEKS